MGRRRRLRRTAGTRRGPREPPSRAGGRGETRRGEARAGRGARGAPPPPGRAPRASREDSSQITTRDGFPKRGAGCETRRVAGREGRSRPRREMDERAGSAAVGRGPGADLAVARARAGSAAISARARVVVPTNCAERHVAEPSSRWIKVRAKLAIQTATDGRGDRPSVNRRPVRCIFTRPRACANTGSRAREPSASSVEALARRASPVLP